MVRCNFSKVWLDIVLACVIAIGSFFAVVLTSNDMGVTYDEAIYAGCGLRFLGWLKLTVASICNGDFVTPFKYETIQSYWHAKDMHPPFPKMLMAFTYLLFSNFMQQGLGAFRSSTAIMFSVLLAFLFMKLCSCMGRTAALFGVLSLFTMPRVFAHAHFVTLDVPVASATFIATVLIAKAIERSNIRLMLVGAFVLGIAFSCKMNAFIAPFGILITFTINWLLGRRDEATKETLTATLKRAFIWVPISTVVAFAFLLLTWPWLWYETPKRLTSYIAFHGKHFPIHTFYLGKLYAYAPWHYPLVMTVVTTPSLTLLMAVAGFLLTILHWNKAPSIARLSLINFLVHIAPFCMPHVPKYNGIRLFMPAMPFIAVLASYSFKYIEASIATIASKTFHRSLRQSFISAFLIVTLTAPAFNTILRIHPFELSYYNALVGGTKGAVYRYGFECTYWGVNIVQLIPFLNGVRDNSLIYILPVGLHAYMQLYMRFGWLKSTLRFTSDENKLPACDFIAFQCSQTEIYNSPLAWFLWRNCKPVYASVYDNVPIVSIYDSNTIRMALSHLNKGRGISKPKTN